MGATHLSERSLLAGRFPELTPHAQDGDGVIGMVLHADMQQVVRVAVRHPSKGVRVRELDVRFDVRRRARSRAGEDRRRGRREQQRRERDCVKGGRSQSRNRGESLVCTYLGTT